MTITLCLDDRGIEEALVAVLCTQVHEVSVQVRGEPGIGWEERIHRVRAGLKTARATLRLLRPGMGDGTWRSTNKALRDAGRNFSDARDADVVLSCYRRLSQERRLRRALRGLEETFRDGQRRSLARIQQGAAVEQALDLLTAAQRRIESQNTRGGWEGVWRGVRRVYRRGRRAWTNEGQPCDADRRHELRKRSKDVRFQLRLLSSLAPRWPMPTEARLHELTDHLGDERDLDLFGEALSQSELIDPQRARSVQQYLDRARQRLLRRVHPLATQVYRSDPRTFVESTRAGFERSLAAPGRGRRRMAALGAASVLAAATAFWLNRECVARVRAV